MDRGLSGIYIYVDGIRKAFSRSQMKNEYFGSITIQSTLKLAEDAKVEIRFDAHLAASNDALRTYFEGRFISSMDDSSDNDN